MDSNIHSAVYELCKNNIIKQLDIERRTKHKTKYLLVEDIGKMWQKLTLRGKYHRHIELKLATQASRES
jgi:hypothetical protein